MEHYAPKARDLASRDVVSRAIHLEVQAGRGCGPRGDHVLLKLDHLGEALIQQRLPGIRDLAIRFAHVDPVRSPIPVYPTAHYYMGGIPTDRMGQVVAPLRHGPEEVLPGLYAVGECACVSVHGANRLGGNSLLDLVVFGRAAGNQILQYLAEHRHHRPLSETAVDPARARLARWDRTGTGESVAALGDELRQVMERYCGVFRTQAVLDRGVAEVQALRARIEDARLTDRGAVFNTERLEALELDNLAAVALATVSSAAARLESRGAHTRVDYPLRDDVHWLRHSLFSLAAGQLDYKPVRMRPLTVDSFPPKERVY
ncbi:MAG TPA: FAD-binding protein, partial [Acidiferrobacteraceae bacterium]|nr:FAD-binding protein [Acidiferrobacteraceae bacterium]